MTEVSTSTPSELKQVKNFRRARKEIKNMDPNPRTFQKWILHGLLTIAPDEINESGILHNPERANTVDELFHYQISLNDRLDFEGSGRTDIDPLIDTARAKEKDKLNKYNESLGKLPTDEKVVVEKHTLSAVQEIEAIEKWIREKRDSSRITFQEIDQYRNLVNAISNTLVSSIIFGPNSLENRLYTIPPDKLTVDEIRDKYAWVSGNNPENNIERAVMIMHNAAMAGQISDDWHDRKIDNLLNVPSYVSGALAMLNGNPNVLDPLDLLWAKRILNGKKDEYRAKASELGLGRLGEKGATSVMSSFAKGRNMLVSAAQKQLRLTGSYHNFSFFGLREKAYIEGKLDPKK